jgi:endonuclease/exonuclease/phosphatase family metal-dependent hydrolase
MRLATYNAQNLFDRAKAMNLASWSQGRLILQKFAELNELLGARTYSPAAKKRMVTLMKQLGLDKADTARFVILRRNKGSLLKRPKTGGVTITASGRASWAGSLELTDEPVDEEAMRNTARVMADLKADVLGVVEVENRPVLAEFNSTLIPAVGGRPFTHVMLIDGNDDRGIDVGLVTRARYSIDVMRSHVDDRIPKGGPIFSRDCPEFFVNTPSGKTILVMVNHFKSKGFGSPAANDAKRKAQAKRVQQIYKQRLADGYQLIAVVGDLNDVPSSNPLAPLLQGTSLQDAFAHPAFNNGGYPGTFGLCNASQKFDYILLSPKLFSRVQTGGVFRKGMWPGKRPARWPVYTQLQQPFEAGSDHAAIWVDLNL